MKREMDPRPKPSEGSFPAEIDLDRTDELPALDLRAHETAPHDRLSETWIQPGLSSLTEAAADPAARTRAEDPLQTAVANLREAQELLAGRSARLVEVENALDEARSERAAVERRVAQLTEELAAARAVAAQRDLERAGAEAEARAAAERREAQHQADLAAARAAAGQREAELGGELERARAAAGQQASDLAEELAAAREVAEQLRTRAATYFESLQTAERRRALFEGLLSDLHEEIDAHQSGHERLTRELAGRDTRAGELESDLGERASRIADLDSQVATLGSALRQRDVELARLRAVETSLTARVEELTRVRGEAEELAGALRAAQLEHSAHLASIAAGEARAKQLEDRMAEQVEMRRTLQSAAEAAVARAHELEADVRAAEENIARLESQLRGRDARVAELERANQQWRHTLDEGHVVHGASGGEQPRRQAPPAEAAEGMAASAPLEGATRLLIRSDGQREVVHVLGRKTTIGRTPENDLQIDVKYISRHHAVILAGPAHTIIEDLNSTNGVMVNGKRITRQTLNDGDLVTIARVEYRFALRRGGEKR
jgi:predicted  nucleic acid-binding Zn-ribbon protein